LKLISISFLWYFSEVADFSQRIHGWEKRRFHTKSPTKKVPRFCSIQHSSMIATRARNRDSAWLRTKAEKPFSLEKDHARAVSMFSDSARWWKKVSLDVRRPRDTLVRQKRVNLAESTSIIGQRPGGRAFHELVKPLVMGFQQAWVLNRCPLRRAVFADADVRLQRRWHRRDAAVDAVATGYSKPVLHAYAPKQLQARKLARAWDKPGPVAERTSGREKRRTERDLIFRLIHRVAIRVTLNSSMVREIWNILDFQNTFDKTFTIRNWHKLLVNVCARLDIEILYIYIYQRD